VSLADDAGALAPPDPTAASPKTADTKAPATPSGGAHEASPTATVPKRRRVRQAKTPSPSPAVPERADVPVLFTESTTHGPVHSAEAERSPGKGITPYRYSKTLEFNPHSSKQVLDLIRSLGLKPPRAVKGEDRETTEAKYLKRFSRKHPVFKLILDCRARQKLLSTYNWPLDAAGRVHTQYGYHPSTWRKSSRSVNLQNIPKRSDLAREFRRMLVASPGHVLIEADAAAIEAVLVGYCANSQGYVRLARAGVHGFLTSHITGKPISADLSDKALQEACKTAKASYPEVYERAKRIVHLSNYLGTPQRIWDEYQEDFSSLTQVKDLQAMYFGLIPEVRKWQRETCERAASQKYLQNPWGYRHYFYSVFAWDRKHECWKLGEDAKRAVAFLPQSMASAIQTEVLLRLWAWDEMQQWLRLIIHDSIVCEVPESQADYCSRILAAEMTRPIPELSGLVVGCEIKLGPNLAEMEEWHP
jgi:DNA polymerase-1